MLHWISFPFELSLQINGHSNNNFGTSTSFLMHSDSTVVVFCVCVSLFLSWYPFHICFVRKPQGTPLFGGAKALFWIRIRIHACQARTQAGVKRKYDLCITAASVESFPDGMPVVACSHKCKLPFAVLKSHSAHMGMSVH